MSRLCVLFDVACVVCGAGACCVDRCAECVCMECWTDCVQYLYNAFTEHAVGLCRLCLLLRTYVSVCLCVIHAVLLTYYYTILYCNLNIH